MTAAGPLHRIELWVPDLARAERSWGWLLTARHDRCAPGPNHLAFTVTGDLVRPRPEARGELASREEDGALQPFTGGPDHRAAYLADADGYEVELVASPGS
ncbi:hypothetical protein [Modestobacter sp. SYSU DS0290]